MILILSARRVAHLTAEFLILKTKKTQENLIIMNLKTVATIVTIITSIIGTIFLIFNSLNLKTLSAKEVENEFETTLWWLCDKCTSYNDDGNFNYLIGFANKESGYFGIHDKFEDIVVDTRWHEHIAAIMPAELGTAGSPINTPTVKIVVKIPVEIQKSEGLEEYVDYFLDGMHCGGLWEANKGALLLNFINNMDLKSSWSKGHFKISETGKGIYTGTIAGPDGNEIIRAQLRKIYPAINPILPIKKEDGPLIKKKIITVD